MPNDPDQYIPPWKVSPETAESEVTRQATRDEQTQSTSPKAGYPWIKIAAMILGLIGFVWLLSMLGGIGNFIENRSYYESQYGSLLEDPIFIGNIFHAV